MQNDYAVCTPQSIEKIRFIANAIRKMVGYEINDAVDLHDLLDVLSVILENRRFNYFILTDKNKRFDGDEEAHTDITNGTIFIKQYVYDDAFFYKRNRAKFTIAHEMGHYFMHHLFGSLLSRRTKEFKAFENPEWQADQFAAELLMPYDTCINLTAKEISDKYRVSLASAKKRYDKLHK